MKKMTKKVKFITIAISSILSVVLVSSIYVICVRNVAITASEESYTALSSQRDVIKEDFNKVYSYDNFTIAKNETGYQVTLSAQDFDIAMKCNFDSEFNYIDSTYIKPPIIDSYIVAIIAFIILGGIFSFLFAWFIKELY